MSRWWCLQLLPTAQLVLLAVGIANALPPAPPVGDTAAQSGTLTKPEAAATTTMTAQGHTSSVLPGLAEYWVETLVVIVVAAGCVYWCLRTFGGRKKHAHQHRHGGG